MAEDTEHKEEPSPLSEEEVEALSEKFTASWEASDSAHAGPKGADPAAPEVPGGRSNLKRTMLGMPVFDPPPPPESSGASAAAIDEATLPRQKTLVGMQAPDPHLVKAVAESFVVPGSPDPAHRSQPSELNDVGAPSMSEASATAASPILSVDVEWPDDTTPSPQGPVSPARTPSPAISAPSVATNAAAPSGPIPPGPVPQGPGLFGWGESPGSPAKPSSAAMTPAPATTTTSAEPPAIRTTAPLGTTASMGSAGSLATTAPLATAAPPETAAPVPAPVPRVEPGASPAASPGTVTVRMGSMAATPPAAPTPVSAPPAEPKPAIESKPNDAQHAVFPEESTLPTGVAPGKPPLPSQSSSPLQSYAPPVAPPPALGSSPTNEKTIVIEDESSKNPEDEARAAAKRMAQRADTLPPQRPRLEIEIPPEFQRRSGKAGLWVAGLLSLVIGAGAVYTLSQSADTPPLSAETSAEVKAVLPEPAGGPEKPAAPEPAQDEASDEAVAKADADADAAAAVAAGDSPSALETAKPATPPKPAPPPASKPATTAAKKTTATTKPTAPPPNKTTKVKKTTKPASKTIVRDAPF